jgi:hypothetical protein
MSSKNYFVSSGKVWAKKYTQPECSMIGRVSVTWVTKSTTGNGRFCSQMIASLLPRRFPFTYLMTFQRWMIAIICWICPGANPTTLSYKASAVKMYSPTNSIARF